MKKYIYLIIAMMTMAATAKAQTVYIAPSKSAIAYHKNKDCSYLRNSVNVQSLKEADAKDMGRHACIRCYPEKKAQTMKDIAKENKTKKTSTAEKTTTEKVKNVYITTAKGATAYHKNKSCTYLKKAPNVEAVTADKAAEMNRVPCKVCYPSTAKKAATTKKATTEKKATAEKKATTTKETKKATPARDEKGRFVKKTTEETKATTKKATPERDEKGRFVKKATTETKDAATKKTTTTKKTTKKAA